jgi:ATP-dependent helicase/nuclease subunit B
VSDPQPHMDDRVTRPVNDFSAPSATDTAALPDGVTVVTPTRRLAYHLRARHDATCLARGLRAWRTPDVVTWQELLRRHFELDRARGATAVRWLDPTHGRLAWESVIRRDAELTEVLSPAGLGARAQHAWQLLHDYAIPHEALAEDPSLEVRAFARWVTEYRRWLRRGGWLDPAEAAAMVGTGEPGATLVLAGFDRLTPAQQATLQRFAADGVDVRHEPEPTPDHHAEPRLVACNDFEAEVATAARWAAARLERRPHEQLALIVPNLAQARDRVRRVLDRVLVPDAAMTGGPAPESTAYELAAARALVDRPVVAAALAWLEAVVGQPDLDGLSALLRSPFDAAAADESLGRAELDAWVRRFEPYTRGLSRLARLAARHGGCPATATQLERAVARTRDWQAPRLPSRWVPEFFALLAEIGWPGSTPGSVEHQVVQRWQALLEQFAASDDVAGPLRASAAIGCMRSLATDIAFEPQEITAPLLVIDPDTALGMRFDGAWLCGLDSTRWPTPASPDPFLPRDWQVRHGVPGATAERAETDARRVLERLRGAAGELVCSVPQFEDEAPLLPSALVAGFAPAGALELWPGRVTADEFFERRPALETIVDAAMPAFATHGVARGGTRLLELQASCPFRAAVELRLGGRVVEQPATGIAATERGNLVHAVLQQVWQALRTRSRLVALPGVELAEWIARLAHDQVEPLRAGADPIRRRLLDLEQRWIEMRVLELLSADADRPPFEVIHVEEPFTLDVGGVQVRLKLDRVDRLDDGTLAVIDYKTGTRAKPAAWMGERPELPQLPLYVRAVGQDAVSAVAFGIVHKGRTRYLGYARDAERFPALVPFVPGERSFKDYGGWEEMLQAWRRRLDAIASEHAQGDARLAPDPRKACRFCHLPGLCRTAQATADDDEEAFDGAD